MALQRQVVPVMLKGLDQLAPKQTGIMSGVDNLLNMYAQQGDQGGYEIVSRPGTTTQPGPASVTGSRLSALGNQLLQFTSDSLYRRVPASNNWFKVAGPSATPGGNGMAISSQATTSILGDNIAATECDIAYVNGYTVTAQIGTSPTAGTSAIFITVSDSTGALQALTTVDASFVAICPRIAVVGTTAVIFWGDSIAGNLSAIKFDATTGTLGARVGVGVGGGMNAIYFPMFDVQAIPSSGKIAILWNSQVTGPGRLSQTLLDPSTMSSSGVVNYATKGTSFVTKGYLANDFSTGTLFVGYISATSGLCVDQFDSTTLAAGTASVYDATIITGSLITGYRTGASTAAVYYTIKGGTNPYDDSIWKSTGAAASQFMFGRAIASRATLANAGSGVLQPLFLTKYRGVGQCTFFLSDNNGSVPYDMARFLPDIAAADPSNALAGLLALPNLMIGATASTYVTCGLRSTAILVSSTGALTSSTGAAAFTFLQNDSTVGRAVEINSALHIPGAIPFLYDGNGLTEEGFPIAPEQSDSYVYLNTGAMTPSSTYTYKYVFEWIDAFGALHQSAPNLVAQAAPLPAAKTSIQHSLPVVIGTRKIKVTLAIYRDVANGDGSTYYRAGSVNFLPQSIAATNRVTFTDTMSDAVLVGQPTLYTDGGILENLSPPSCTSMALHRGRILAGGVAGDQTAVWFSKEVTPGFGVAFNDGLVSRLNSANESVTALGSMDSFAAAFTSTTTWTSTDDYPDDTGTGGVLKFSQSSSANGCAGPRLIARADDGLMCWQAKTAFIGGPGPGPWRFSRGSSWDWIGKAIQLDSAALTPKTFLLVPGLNQIRVLGSTATVLVRETTFETWATWTYLQGSPTIVDMIVLSGAVVYLLSDGTTLIESTSIYSDSGVAVAHSLTMAPFNFAGVAGYQRIYVGQLTGRILGTAGLSESLQLSVTQTIDGTAMAPVSRTLTPDANSLFAGVEFDPGVNGKCSAYQVTISNVASTPNDSRCAWTLAALTMEVGIKPNINRLPPAQRAQ